MTDIEKAELIKEIVRLQQRMFSTIGQRVPQVWMELDLTIEQLKSLLFINFQGSTNFKSLATALGVTPPNVTGIINRLVAQDLVSREENPEDRRMLLLKLTDRGRAKLTRLQEVAMDQASELLNYLSLDELNALNTGLLAINRVIDIDMEKRYIKTFNGGEI